MSARYCAANEACRQTLRQKLYAWGAAADEAAAIVDWLVAGGYIDEERFAKAYVDSKVRYQQWGRKKIEFQLRGKGLDAATIRHALQGIDEETYLGVLANLARTKAKSLPAADPDNRRLRLTSYLMGRGFEYDLINNIIDDILRERNDE